MAQENTYEVVADTATSRDTPGQREIESFQHAENDRVQPITKRPASRASMCAPAITAYEKTSSSVDNEKRAALKTLLDRSAKAPLPQFDADADESFTSLFAPVAKDAVVTEDYEENIPVLNVADIPDNVSLASLAAARAMTNVNKKQTEQKTGIANIEENASSKNSETTRTPATSNSSKGSAKSTNSLLSRFRIFGAG